MPLEKINWVLQQYDKIKGRDSDGGTQAETADQVNYRSLDILESRYDSWERSNELFR